MQVFHKLCRESSFPNKESWKSGRLDKQDCFCRSLFSFICNCGSRAKWQCHTWCSCSHLVINSKLRTSLINRNNSKFPTVVLAGAKRKWNTCKRDNSNSRSLRSPGFARSLTNSGSRLGASLGMTLHQRVSCLASAMMMMMVVIS